MGVSQSNMKKFRVSTTYADSENIYVKRATHKNTLYIYVYERRLLRNRLLVALRVIVCE